MPHDTLELVLSIDGEGADDEARDDLARQLMREIREELALEARPLEASEVPNGAKAADAMAVATLVMPLLVSVAPKLVDLLKGWASRGGARKLTLVVRSKNNELAVIEYDPTRTSADDLKQLVALAQGS